MEKLNILYLNGNLTVTGKDLFMMKPNTPKEVFTELLTKNEAGEVTIEYLNSIFISDLAQKIEQNKIESQKQDYFQKLISLAQGQISLEMKDGALFMKGIPVSLTETIAQSFVEAIETQNVVRLDALKKFWVLVAQNPNDRTRKDLDQFLKKGRFQLASNGWVVGYRAANTYMGKNTALYEFIVSSLEKVSAWKKTAKDYTVFQDYSTGEYSLKRSEAQKPENMGRIGLLSDLDQEKNWYKNDTLTPSFNGGKNSKGERMLFQVGDFVKEDDIEDDPTVTCGKGLHFTNMDAVGIDYYLPQFGSRYMIVLVNPAHIRAVPLTDNYNKARTSEYYFLNTLDKDAEGKVIIPNHYQKEVLVLSEELEQKLSTHTYDQLYELVKSEINAGNIPVGQLIKLVNIQEIPSLDENVFQKILNKIEEVDKQTVPKKYMDVYSMEQYQQMVEDTSSDEWDLDIYDCDDDDYDDYDYDEYDEYDEDDEELFGLTGRKY